MANGRIKITDLPETTLAKDEDIFIIENDTTTQKISLGSLINYIKEHEEIAAHFLKSSAVNSPNGVAPLDNSKKIPYANLPVGTTENTILDGALGQALSDSFSFHSADTGNPHAVTKSQIGLSDVDNTADTAKPVSTLQQQAIDTAYAGSNAYTDAKIAELIDGAPSTLDTLGEIARALQEGGGISDALDAAIGTKASQAELDSHTENDTIHISASERTKWNEITALISHIASKATAATLGHVKLSDTYTSTIAEGAAANGMGASQKAVADTYSSLSSRLSDSLGGMTFGVDEDGNYGYIKAGADSVTPFRNGITKIASFSGHWNTDEGDVTLSSPLPSLNVTDYILVPTEILTNTGNTGGMNSPIDTVFVPQMTIISNTKVHIKMGFRKTFTADWGSQFLVTHVNGDIYYIK